MTDRTRRQRPSTPQQPANRTFADAPREQLSLQEALVQAAQLHRAGRLEEAEAAYRRILHQLPRQQDALCLLGVIAFQRGDYKQAETLLKNSLSVEPNNAGAHNNLGALYSKLENHESAISHFQKAIALNPNLTSAKLNLGSALLKKGAAQDALQIFRKLAANEPTLAQAHSGAGDAFRAMERFSAAIKQYKKALKRQPNFDDARIGLIDSLIRDHKPDAALNECSSALKENPLNATLFRLRSRAFSAIGDAAQAENALVKCLLIRPDDVEVLSELAKVLSDRGKLSDAIETLEKAITLEPGHAQTYALLGSILTNAGRLDEAIVKLKHACELRPDYAAAQSNLLFTMNHAANCSAGTIFEEARTFGAKFDAILRVRRRPRAEKLRSDKLRVGLVSSDFRHHAVAYFLLSAVEAVDQSKFELAAYYGNSRRDDVTRRFQKTFSLWRSIDGVSDADAAQQIANDEIDILIDLAGHTKGGRLPVFARKPAPVQATWLGYSGTTGLTAMDHVLCDQWEIPESEEPFFTEHVWRLPDTRHCYALPDADIPVGPPPAQENGYVTFGVFQRRAKITAEVAACFANVLKRVRNSRILFRGIGFENSPEQADALSLFARHGVSEERVAFLPRAKREDFLSNYSRVDIALSPFPWPGVTSGFEGLWMGVPSVFLRGDRFLGRIGECVAANLDMHDWIAGDVEEYAGIAAQKASDIESLSSLRKCLRERFVASPLCDAGRFARNLETAFQAMWQRYLEG